MMEAHDSTMVAFSPRCCRHPAYMATELSTVEDLKLQLQIRLKEIVIRPLDLKIQPAWKRKMGPKMLIPKHPLRKITWSKEYTTYHVENNVFSGQSTKTKISINIYFDFYMLHIYHILSICMDSLQINIYMTNTTIMKG